MKNNKIDDTLDWSSRLVKYIIIKSSCLELLSEIQRNMLCETIAIAFHALLCNGHISVFADKPYAWILSRHSFCLDVIFYQGSCRGACTMVLQPGFNKD
jgi:hypothetical protein